MQLRQLTVGLGLTFSMVFAANAGPNANANQKAKMVAAAAPAVSFEQCCEKNSNDSAACHKMTGVTGKKAQKGKKWEDKMCPKPAATTTPAEATQGGDGM